MEDKPIRSLNILDIQKSIPHRYPFLFVDKVDIIEENKKAIGYKSVTMNEWFFQGHFPQQPIFPGVLIIEALAQTACTLFLSRIESKNKLAFLMGINNTKFRTPVEPGDLLTLNIEVLKAGTRSGKAKGIAKVKDQIATETEFSFALVDKPT